ncbi:Flavin-binding monooxygenase-like [Geosmithia morbida]|uniref:Flavin-binding monooxygenase-like n=1 Tax=Geosmithia morbida TaxID=1094350 RepID=A0A9P4Z287_9HYPO|nr:Flavin-binding monooxygenase-like [Geosmithia morbida]KAF4126082.1 Flavin-binding monooxygenase-like [Geosmithia morbida]
MRVAVIGGGPSGLVQLKTLLEAHQYLEGIEPFEVRLFESYDRIGGVFVHHTYEDAELVSSKWITTFSDFGGGRPGDGDFFSAERYVEYLNDYATHFRLWPYMHLSTAVTGIRRGDVGGHVVSYRGPDGLDMEWECDAVAVCSGVHSKANYPDIPGLEHVPVTIHSEDIKKREQLGKDTTVLVLGSGETGADMCYLAITAPTRRVILSHKDGFLGGTKRAVPQRWLPWLFGDHPFEEPQLPIDVSQSTLFDTMYVHPMVRDSLMVWDAYHVLALPFACWLCSSTSRGVDQHIGQVFGERFHTSRLFFNKAWMRISNEVSTPWRPNPTPLGTRIRKFFLNTAVPPPKRTIELAPFPSHITPDGVAHFPRNGRPEADLINETEVKPDVIVFATGYVPQFPFLNTPHNAGRRAYPTSSETDVRDVWRADDPTIGFIGFIRPGFGAIPPLAEMQSMLFATQLAGRLTKRLDPEDEWHYRMIQPPSARLSYGVEHDSYMYQVAKDLDMAPSFTDVARLSLVTPRGHRLPWMWASGANFTLKFRMVGPWRWPAAAETLTGDMWQTISRRGNIFGNYNMAIAPIIYLGLVNLFYWTYATIWGALATVHLAPPVKVDNAIKRRFQELADHEEAMMKKKKMMGLTNGLGR